MDSHQAALDLAAAMDLDCFITYTSNQVTQLTSMSNNNLHNETRTRIKDHINKIVLLNQEMEKEIKGRHYMCSDPSRIHSYGRGPELEIAVRKRYSARIKIEDDAIDALIDLLITSSISNTSNNSGS